MESAPTSFSLSRIKDRTFFIATAALSLAALAFIGYILVVRDTTAADGSNLGFLPSINASLNAASATLLVLGYIAIRRGARRAHQFFMVTAFVVSSLFLVGYLVYHYVHGDTKYPVGAPLRTLYLAILTSHILTSAVVVPLVLTSFYWAIKRRFDQHKRTTRFTLPLWLYVSVTGVVIYFMLRSALAGV